jgi:recombination protein RecA
MAIAATVLPSALARVVIEASVSSGRLSQIERQFGKGSVMKLGKNDRSMDIEVISSGSLGLDIALGVGGLPKGRVIEIYGPESSGKTTLALHCAAEAQKKGGICAFIDAEHALDPVYARKLGVNVDELLISQPDHGEQALEIADTLVRSGAVDVLIIDSVAALVPRAELEGEMGDALPGLQARLMSQALRKLTASINKSNTMVIFINQIRMKIGVMYGSPETTTGGNALKFYASVRLDIRRIGAIKERDEVVGNSTRVKVVKNKLAPPFKQVEFDIMYGEGVSKMGEILDLGVKAGIVEKSGAWFSYDSQRLGQGRENSKAFLKANPDMTAKIEASIRQNSGLIAEVQFKNVFTGLEQRPYKTASTAQKCVRAGGKHNDLDNVGYTARHHTFFEMLGNFSFGDYFKEQAIEHAWTLITKEFGIDAKRLLVTVYHTDDEAFNLWKKIAGLSDDRIIRIATSDNFWAMGDTGPCGPCSEIFYDHGDHIWGGPPGSPDEDGDRFIEIWNLVFMQYEQLTKEERVDLPRPSIDTGMGLERVAALLQGKHDNYDIDLFRALIAASEEATGVKAEGEQRASHRVIADHFRSSAFLIADGVLPSNEGRGYVLRRIMRRAMRHAAIARRPRSFDVQAASDAGAGDGARPIRSWCAPSRSSPRR